MHCTVHGAEVAVLNWTFLSVPTLVSSIGRDFIQGAEFSFASPKGHILRLCGNENEKGCREC